MASVEIANPTTYLGDVECTHRDPTETTNTCRREELLDVLGVLVRSPAGISLKRFRSSCSPKNATSTTSSLRPASHIKAAQSRRLVANRGALQNLLSRRHNKLRGDLSYSWVAQPDAVWTAVCEPVASI
ncbi:hypothetical protein EVAR_67107_1 [Eumeta japonica]|uniref:Uncharacterized protein n=1 Tax=Eumeta variegata TaxID=151549 RepID=A0A4C1ZFY0_EUMVA|nr:hypothetical protein EVAR_67107_1 [Eumeta japonica]